MSKLNNKLSFTYSCILMMMSFNAGAEMVNGEELIDPTAPFLLEMSDSGPAVNIFATLSSYSVSSILIRENLRVAVINSQRVREGEYIGSALVEEINESSVLINLGEEKRVLSLHGAVIKTRTGE